MAMTATSMAALVSGVRVVMDENRVSTSLVASNDIETLSLNELIERNVITAARTIEMMAPRHLLTDVDVYDKSNIGTATFSLEQLGEKHVGSLNLPTELLRVVGVKMSDWTTEGRLIDGSSPEYACQRSKWLGVGGTPEHPVAALVPHAAGGMKLEMYCSKKQDAALSYMTFITAPTKGSDGNVNICELLKDAIIYMAASLTCTSLGESQTAAGLRDEAFLLAEITTTDK